MGVFSTNHLQQGEEQLEWHTIQLVLLQLQKGMRCFQVDGLPVCRQWRDILEILHHVVNWVRLELVEQLRVLLLDMPLVVGGIMNSLPPMNIAQFRTLKEECFVPRPQDDETDPYRAARPSESMILSPRILVVVAICRRRKVLPVNSPSSFLFSRTTIPRMRYTQATKLPPFGHTSHEQGMSSH
jgi:hypothetical protein